MSYVDGSVKSAKRVLDLLELMVVRAEPLSLTEVAAALEMPKSSAHSLLQTLVSTGFFFRSKANRYQLGMKWHALMSAAIESSGTFESANLREVAYPAMLELARRTRMTCNLAVLNGHDVVYIDKVQDRSNSIQLSTHVGASLPAHATALGKALVADLDSDVREKWLRTNEYRTLTDQTKGSPETLRIDLEHARRVGYAVDDEEFHRGVMCVAAAIRDHVGQTVAAISLTAFKAQMEEAGIDRIGRELSQVVARISAGLGASA